MHLLDLPHKEQVLKGVRAELHDCAFPLLEDIVVTSDLSTAFRDVSYSFLVGSKSHSDNSIQRVDLLADNAKIFYD